jgi:hypothetical protein
VRCEDQQSVPADTVLHIFYVPTLLPPAKAGQTNKTLTKIPANL